MSPRQHRHLYRSMLTVAGRVSINLKMLREGNNIKKLKTERMIPIEAYFLCKRLKMKILVHTFNIQRSRVIGMTVDDREQLCQAFSALIARLEIILNL